MILFILLGFSKDIAMPTMVAGKMHIVMLFTVLKSVMFPQPTSKLQVQQKM
jgi:hypothetical protein